MLRYLQIYQLNVWYSLVLQIQYYIFHTNHTGITYLYLMEENHSLVHCTVAVPH